MKPQLTRLAPWSAPALLAAMFLFAGAWSSPADTEEDIEKSFTLKRGGTLVVEVEFGSIDVTTHDAADGTIKVHRRVQRSDKATEEAFLQERPVTFEQDGDLLTVRSVGPKKAGRSNGRQKTEGRYTIALPSQFNVRLKTAGGNIDVKDLTGEVQAQTSGGGLTFAQIHGPLDGQTAGGNVRLSQCEGELRVKSSGGGIEAEGGKGSLDGRTSGGPVSVKDFHGPVSVQTGGGGIKLENVDGKIAGTTSGGSISASVPKLSDEVKLVTSGGAVTFRAPEGSAFDLDATSSGGGVVSEWNVDGGEAPKPTRQKLKGAVNGGGKPVVLRTTGGTIQLKKL
jgi:hypothetical protein